MSPFTIIEQIHGTLADTRKVKMYTLKNANGMSIQVSEFGATLLSVRVPDRSGKIAEITHGYDTLDEWVKDNHYFGATVGRFANRIAGGKFTLNGKTYSLPLNNAPGGMECSLHGGAQGFNKRLWKSEIEEKENSAGIIFLRISKNQEEGYPGNVMTSVAFRIFAENILQIEITAETDAATPINITNHTYWNLSGEQSTDILGHKLQIFADSFLPTNPGLIPTGEVKSVQGTPLDFRQEKRIGEDINEAFEALEISNGYDHAWVFDNKIIESPRLMARLHDPKSGRIMELSSNQPALQFYSGNFLDGTTIGRADEVYPRRSALALEPEAYPDAPNHGDFPNSILRPGERYNHQMQFRFFTDKA